MIQMAVVSKYLDFVDAPMNRKQRLMGTNLVVGQIGNDFGDNRNDVPFVIAPALQGIPTRPELRSYTRRPIHLAENRPLGYVPLKCNQEGSHVEGAALFVAPAYDSIPVLKFAEAQPREYFVVNTTQDAGIQFQVPIDYNEGIRPGIRLLPTQNPIHEPAGMVYRKAYKPKEEKLNLISFPVNDEKFDLKSFITGK